MSAQDFISQVTEDLFELEGTDCKDTIMAMLVNRELCHARIAFLAAFENESTTPQDFSNELRVLETTSVVEALEDEMVVLDRMRLLCSNSKGLRLAFEACEGQLAENTSDFVEEEELVSFSVRNWLAEPDRLAYLEAYQSMKAGSAQLIDSRHRGADLQFTILDSADDAVLATLSLHLNVYGDNVDRQNDSLKLEILEGELTEPVVLRSANRKLSLQLVSVPKTSTSLAAFLLKRNDLIELLATEDPWILSDANGNLGTAQIKKI